MEEISLYYREKGAGIPLVLLHGNGESGEYFRHQIDFFSDRFRVIAVDTRGHGKSPRGTAPFTIAQFAKDLNDFLERLGLSQIILLGFSDGANIALQFALNHPAKLRALILNGGNLNPGGVKRRVQLPIEIGYRIAERFSNQSENAKRNTELLGLMVLEPQLKAETLRTVTVPTLVIAGKRDMIKESHTREMAGHLPNATLCLIPGDHFIANRRPEPFNRAVAQFLDKALSGQ